MQANDDIAVLIGNGLSVAYNPALTMGSLTSEIVERFNDAAGGGTDAAQILAGFAADVGESDPSDDFEALLGPLDQIGDSLARFEGLADMTAGSLIPGEITASIATITDFLKEVQRLGVGHALEVIDDRAYADQDDLAIVRDFMAAIIKASRTANITVGNLNYDSLVMSALLSLDVGLCDMARGWPPYSARIGGSYAISGHALRTKPDFLDRQCLLLHLHGSVSWLRSPNLPDHIVRFSMQDLRIKNYWEKYRTGRTNWSPVVVLTNQRAKSSVVSRWPFSLAYETFFNRLMTSDRWLIAGYSFRDECVNDLLSRAFRSRPDHPEILVITRSKAPTVGRILGALKWDREMDADPDEFLWTFRGGVADAPASDEWHGWCGA